MDRTTPLIVALACVLGACGASLRRLDEATVYQGPSFELKVVRYYENLPLHFTGEISVVQCRSEHTRERPAGRTNDAGWVPLGRAAALGSSSAGELVERVRSDYLVLEDRVLVWRGLVLKLSADGCESFATWDPSTLPAEWIVPAEKPDYCAPKGSGDCRYEDFRGEREPVYSDIHASPDGEISFVVHSKAFRDERALRVLSTDFGATWQVTEAGE